MQNAFTLSMPTGLKGTQIMKSRTTKGLLPALLFSVSVLFLPTAFANAAQGKCDVTATGLNFPTYNIFNSSSTTATGTIVVTCTIPPQNPAAALSVTISLSPGSSMNFSQRKMTNASGDNLYYNLYTDPSYVTVFGDGNGSSRTLTGFVDKSMPWNLSYFARIPPNQDAVAGSYTDTITVTINW